MSKWLRLLFAALVIAAALPCAAQTDTPSPPIAMPTMEMFEALATLNASMNSAPSSLTSPTGSPLLPGADGRQVFSYAKWLLSPVAAEEFAGPLAPVFQHVGVGLTMMFTLLVIYMTTYIGAYTFRFVAWLYRQFLLIVDVTMQILQAGPMLLVLAVILFVAFVLFSQEAVRGWVAEQVSGVIEWARSIVPGI